MWLPIQICNGYSVVLKVATIRAGHAGGGARGGGEGASANPLFENYKD